MFFFIDLLLFENANLGNKKTLIVRNYNFERSHELKKTSWLSFERTMLSQVEY